MSTRTKNIDSDIKQKILHILDNWEGELTWDLLLDNILTTHMLSYTRQTLNKHDDIKEAFKAKKSMSKFTESKTQRKYSTPEMQIAMDQLEKSESTNHRLRLENDRLLEKFAIWLYNASSRGLSESFLNNPLPKVNRDISKVKIEKVK